MRDTALHLCFEGFEAAEASSEAFLDNVGSNCVSQALGYERNGTTWATRRGQPEQMQRWRITREKWLPARRDDIRMTGVDACKQALSQRPLFVARAVRMMRSESTGGLPVEQAAPGSGAVHGGVTVAGRGTAAGSESQLRYASASSSADRSRCSTRGPWWAMMSSSAPVCSANSVTLSRTTPGVPTAL